MKITHVVYAYNNLDKVDLRILRIIEVLHRNHEYVPYSMVVKFSGLDEEVVKMSLRRLNEFKLVNRRGAQQYRLTFTAYDILAIHTMAKRGVLKALSPTPLGVGKESDVYAADGLDGSKYAAKFHRLGRVRFRNVRRDRVWIGERRHITWLYEARISAHMEFLALVKAQEYGIPTPKPRALSRHLVVMEYFNGIEASKLKLTQPEAVWGRVIDAVEAMLRANMVHGDLTQFNILVNPEDEDDIAIIDWPQWMYANVKGASAVLRRDLENLARFFNSNYGLGIDIGEVWGRLKPLLPKEEVAPGKAYARLLNMLIRKLSKY